MCDGFPDFAYRPYLFQPNIDLIARFFSTSNYFSCKVQFLHLWMSKKSMTLEYMQYASSSRGINLVFEIVSCRIIYVTVLSDNQNMQMAIFC